MSDHLYNARNELWQDEIQQQLRNILEDDTVELERTISHLCGSVDRCVKLDRFPELKALGASVDFNDVLKRTAIFIPKLKPWIPVHSLVFLSRVMVGIILSGFLIRVGIAFLNDNLHTINTNN